MISFETIRDASPGFIKGAAPIFAAILGAYWSQRALLRYQRQRDETARALDDLLKPLLDAVDGAVWHEPPLGLDAAYRWQNRWESDVSSVNERARATETHRLAKYIRPELEAIRSWLDDESILAAHWDQATHVRGVPGRAIFAYLVPDTSKGQGTFHDREAQVAVSVVTPGLSDDLVAEALKISTDAEVWREAQLAAARHREMEQHAQDLRRAAIDAMRHRLIAD